MNNRETAEGRAYARCAALSIEASDWLNEPDVRRWVRTEGVPCCMYDDTTLIWVFVTWDAGEGSHNPEAGGTMPLWLWEQIKKVVADAGLTRDFCIIRLESDG